MPYRLDAPSFPFIFTRSGVKKAVKYDARCSRRRNGCNKVISFWDNPSDYHKSSDQSFWEAALLEEFIIQLVHTGNSFTLMSTVYNELHKTHESEKMLSPQRLEEALLSYM